MRGPPPSDPRVCLRDELEPGHVVTARLSDDAEGRPREALVLLDEAGEARAYVNRCRHLPIPLDGGSRVLLTQDGSHLRCGTHGALYRLHDGECVLGPCVGLRLEALPIVIRDGWVVLEPDTED